MAKIHVVLADYRCGCTWMGRRRNCLEYCGKHGENRRQVIRLPEPVDENECGWDWEATARKDKDE